MIRLAVTYTILLVVFLIPNGLEWIMCQQGLPRMALYHFFHGNIFHLLANALTMYYILPRAKQWHLAAGYIIGSLSLLVATAPVVGFSNIIYALIGVRTPSLRSSWWKHPGTLTFLSVTVLMLLFPRISAVTHIVSFVAGVLVSISVRQINMIKNDSARYI